ncbi:MAG: hypothetical protein R3F34_08930 [Planctomycetota bacterium]
MRHASLAAPFLAVVVVGSAFVPGASAARPQEAEAPAPGRVEADVALLRELGDRCPSHVFRRLANVEETAEQETAAGAFADAFADSDLSWRTRSLALVGFARLSAENEERAAKCIELARSWLGEGSGSLRRAAALEALDELGSAGDEVLRSVFTESPDTWDRIRAYDLFNEGRELVDYSTAREYFEKGGKKSDAAEKKEWAPKGALGPLRDRAFDVLADEMRGEEVEDALEDRSPFVRERAHRVLDDRDDGDVPDLAEKLFEDDDADVGLRRWAAEAIAKQFDRERHYTYLFETAISTKFDPEVRNHTATRIRFRMPQRVLDIVRKKLGSGKPFQKLFAIDSLPMFVVRGLSGPGRGPGGRRGEEDDDEPQAFDDEKVFAELQSNLGDKDQSVRIESLRALVVRNAPDALTDVVRAARKAKDDLDRAALLRARLHFGDEEKDLLADARGFAASESASDALRRASLAVLTLVDPDGNEELLRAGMADPAVAVPAGVVEAVVERRWPRGVGVLIDSLDDPNIGTRDAALAALWRLTGLDLGPSTSNWADWWKSEIGGFKVAEREVYDDLVEGWGDRLRRENVVTEFFGVPVRHQNLAIAFDLGPEAIVEPATRRSFRGEALTSYLDLLRAEATDLARESGPLVRLVGLAGLEAKAASWDGVAALDGEHADAFERWLASLAPVRTTDVWQLLEAAERNVAVEELVIVTTGSPDKLDLEDAEARRRAFSVRNRERGLVVHGVALGRDSRPLQWLAESSGGTYVFVP